MGIMRNHIQLGRLTATLVFGVLLLGMDSLENGLLGQPVVPDSVTLALVSELPRQRTIALVLHDPSQTPSGIVVLTDAADANTLVAALAVYKRVRNQPGSARVELGEVRGMKLPADEIRHANETLVRLRAAPLTTIPSVGDVRTVRIETKVMASRPKRRG